MTPPPAPAPAPAQPQPEPAANVISPVKPAVSIGGPSTVTPEAAVDLGSNDVSFDRATGTTTVNFVGDALFDSGKATLKDSAKKNLDKMAAALKKQYAGKSVKVNGFSDSDPIRHSKWKSNQELSEARAKAVRDYLVLKGVNGSLVSFTGFGEAQPKSTTDKAKNRRVEIQVASR
jgi:flagellar motor protein MotB